MCVLCHAISLSQFRCYNSVENVVELSNSADAAARNGAAPGLEDKTKSILEGLVAMLRGDEADPTAAAVGPGSDQPNGSPSSQQTLPSASLSKH